jgi:hypothetical protein
MENLWNREDEHLNFCQTIQEMAARLAAIGFNLGNKIELTTIKDAKQVYCIE